MALKALLVGINAYQDTTPLNGCLNDVRQIHDLLTQRYGLAAQRTRILTDGAATRAAIVDGLRWLAQPDPDETAPVRLFHFSGHGVFQPDENGDEPDGRDECLVPIDYQSAGYLYDDALKELYEACGAKTHLLLVMDCCHSGGNQRDLANAIVYRTLVGSDTEEEQRERLIRAAAERNRKQRDASVRQTMRELLQRSAGSMSDDEFERRYAEIQEKFDKKHYGLETVGGNSVLIAACRPDQKAGDTRFGDAWNGVLTYHFIAALAGAARQLTYAALISEIGRALRNRFDQVPQLECSPECRDLPFLVQTSG
jgi:hypothetical protein